MRDHRAVGELHHGMYQTLPLHDNLYLVGRYAEKPFRLDHFQALVGERRRVYRDFRAHLPVRVLEGVFGLYRLHLLERVFAEHAAGRRYEKL